MTKYFEELEDLWGEIARIYYADDDHTICVGYHILIEGHSFHPCKDEEKAFRVLSRSGFRY